MISSTIWSKEALVNLLQIALVVQAFKRNFVLFEKFTPAY